jgi:hypothetical protein
LNVFRESPDSMMKALIKLKYFKECKEIAKALNLSTNDISMDIGNTLFKSLKNRIVDKEEIFQQIDQNFTSYETPSDLCGNFFILKSMEYQNELELKDLLLILNLSSKWFHEMDSKKLESDLEFLENCITILSTCSAKFQFEIVLNEIKERIIHNKKDSEKKITYLLPLTLDRLLHQENVIECERCEKTLFLTLEWRITLIMTLLTF